MKDGKCINCAEPLCEFAFDPESADRIARAIELYPLTLKGCAEIIEVVAPLCNLVGEDGATAYIRRFVDRRIGMEQNLYAEEAADDDTSRAGGVAG